ncbi:hypothetical protein ASD43_04985 [Microbacterium sp. Root553]|nr:hypothetical protein ASD43_04985 [Microbacterium sp. Root553]
MGLVRDFALRPQNIDKPYAGYLRDADGRLRGPSDLTADELATLTSAVDDIPDLLTRIRVHDVLMLSSADDTRTHHEARVYAGVIELLETAPSALKPAELHVCTRAVALVVESSPEELERIDAALVDRMQHSSDYLAAVNLSLARGRVSKASRHTARIAPLLTAAADREESDPSRLTILREALHWSHHGDKRAIARQVSALLLERAATLVTSSPPQAITDVDEALDVLQRDTSAEAQTLRDRLAGVRQDASIWLRDSMHKTVTPLSIPPEVMAEAVAAVRGKSTSAAVTSFLSRMPFARSGPAADDAARYATTSLLSKFAVNHIGPTGQIVARVDPRRDETSHGYGVPTKVWRQMIHAHQSRAYLIAAAAIAPALHVLREDHTLRLDDFVAMASDSALVPDGRERSVGRALFSGYEGDSVDAVERLGPQLEHMVRMLLRRHGVPTSRMNANKGVIENSLSSLMKPGRVDDLLGTDIAFEIRALFCSPFGPNLRNDYAHGLRDDEESSLMTMYAWWLCWKLLRTPLPGPSTIRGKP